MVNECNVIYVVEKGLMTFDKKKVVFQHRENENNAKIGLGRIVEGTFEDKGNYAFGVFENVDSVMPENYATVSFFNNRGVPMQVFVGTYGDNILVKEVYQSKVTIRAYAEDGHVLLYENKVKKGKDYTGPNMYYARIDELVGTWEEITAEFEDKLLIDLKNKEAVLHLSNEKVIQALKGLSDNKIVRLEHGVIIADGKFESLVIWNEDHEVQMAWLGRKINLDNYKHTDITEELRALI